MDEWSLIRNQQTTPMWLLTFGSRPGGQWLSNELSLWQNFPSLMVLWANFPHNNNR